jgi:hypothetical protein
MKPWFKALDINSRSMRALMDAHGYDGVGMAFQVMQVVGESDIESITVNDLCRWLKLYPRRAVKLLPFMAAVVAEFRQVVLGKKAQTLQEVSQNFDQSFEEVSANIDQTSGKVSQNISESLVNLEGEKPRESNKYINKLEPLEKKEESEQKARACDSKFLDEVTRGADYLAKSGNPNLTNLGWVPGFLERKFTEYAERYQDRKPGLILAAWCATCDKASAEGKSALKWFEKVFDDLVANPRQPVAGKPLTAHLDKIPAWRQVSEALARGQPIQHTRTGRVYQPDEIYYRPINKTPQSNLDTIYHVDGDDLIDNVNLFQAYKMEEETP